MIWRAQMIALVLTAPLGVPDMIAAHWKPAPVAALIALGAMGTGVAHVVMSVAAGRLGATRALPARLFSFRLWRFFWEWPCEGKETLAPLSVAGSMVCIAGAWLMRRAREVAFTPRGQ